MSRDPATAGAVVAASFSALPAELIVLVSSYLHTRDSLVLAATSSTLHNALNDITLARFMRTDSCGDWPLWWAAGKTSSQAFNTAKRALELGADPNAFIDAEFLPTDVRVQWASMTPLLLATRNKNAAMVELLLQHGGDPCVSGKAQSPVTMAASLGDLASLRLFMSYSSDSPSLPAASMRAAPTRARPPRIMTSRDSNGDTPLHLAAAYGNDAVAEFLLQHGARVDARSRTRATPLHEAIEHGKRSTVDLLVGYGADLLVLSNRASRSWAGQNSLDMAVQAATSFDHKHHSNGLNEEESLDLLRHLLLTRRRFATDGRAWLNIPEDRAHMLLVPCLGSVHGSAVLKTLLESGVKADAVDNVFPLTALWENTGYVRSPEDEERICTVAQMLLDAGADIECRGYVRKQPVLHRAAATGNVRLVALLVERHADLDARDEMGFSLLHTAAMCAEKVDILEWLLGPRHNRGSALDKAMSQQLTSSVGEGRMTPLVLALLYGHRHAAMLLLNCEGVRADVASNGGNSTLGTAMHHSGLVTLASMLVQNGASVNERDDRGRTPLMIAATHECLEGVQYLLREGAKVDAIRDRGPRSSGWTRTTALVIAARAQALPIASLLINYGASLTLALECDPQLLGFLREGDNLGLVSLMEGKVVATTDDGVD
ncbi:ankyrin repeat domain-containing protein 50 [Microdochium nivale]|nr:ankyrin repeat domain-containing protein 50 [Microdochium nivale]